MIIRPSSTTVCTSATCDLPILCRPSSLHSSSFPLKTVPFLPRVILSVQPSFPSSTVDSQTPFFQTSSAIPTEAHQPLLSQQLATLHLSPLASTNSAVVTHPSITVSTVQFCPLVLTATSKSQSSISTIAPAPIHLQVASSPITSVCSSEVVTFSDKISAASSNPMPAVNMECDGNLSPTLTPSTSLITSLVNKGRNQSSVTVASVVITPQCSAHMQSAFALRLASSNSVRCTSATTNSANPSSCPSLMDTSTFGNQSSSAMHASLISTPSLHTNATVEQSIFGTPVLPPDSPSLSRVLIQKPSNLVQVTQPPNSAAVESSSLTLVCASSKNANLSPSASGHMISKTGSFVSDAFNIFHNLNSPKSKLVNLASSVTPNVRLLATSKPILTTTVSAASLSNAPANLPALTSPMKCSISNPVSVWSGVNNTSTVNPTNIFSVQTSHPLLVQTSSEASAAAATGDSSSLVTAVTNSSASPSTVAPVGASAYLHGMTPTVLAFSLTSTTASSCNVSTTNFVTGSCAMKQLAPTTPLVIRTYCNSTVTLSTGPSVPPTTATLASTSLLKPFSAGVTQNASSPPAGIPTALPHIIPVSIAPAKFQTSAAICSTFSSVRTHPISSVTTARYGPTTIFSQTNRKRARKQQLASTFPNSANAVSPPVTVSSNPSVNSSGSNTISTVPTTQQSSSTNRSSSNFMTTIKSGVPTFQPTHQLHVTHSAPAAPTIPTSLGPSLCSSDIGVKIACPINLSGVNTVNGTSSSISTTPGSFIGIRLVSVRANPLSAASNSCSVANATGAHLSTVGAPSTSGVGSRPIAINSSESSPLIPVPFSSCISQCSTQFRITTAHAPTSELHPSPSTTVYVLTSSAYPVVPNTTALPVTITQSSMMNTMTADTSSTPVSSSSVYTAALMIPGGPAAGGMLQLRVRPPFSNSALITNASTSSLTPFLLEDSSSSVSSELIHSIRTGHDGCSKSHCLCSVRDALPKSHTPPIEMIDLLPVKQTPHRTFITSSASSLLHRHLLSPQNPIHIEPQHEQCNLPDKPTSDVSTDAGISDPCQKTLSESEVQFLPYNKSAKFKDQGFISVGDKTRNPTHKPMKQLLNEVTAAEEILRYEDSDEEGAGTPQALRLPRKQLRLDKEHSGKLATDVNMFTHGGKLLTESVLGVDPISGCEWVLTGLPTKPPITPRQHSFGVRTSGIWRPKSSHFLSASEIRLKLDSKFSLNRRLRFAAYSKGFRHSDVLLSTNCRRRRRRRAAITAAVDNRRITDTSVDESATNTYSKASAMQYRLLHDLMTMRMKQKELQLLHFPLTASSVLSLTGWRALTCANNLDLLVYAEHQEILSLESLGTSLHDWLTPGLQHSTSERVIDSTSFQCIKSGSLQPSADHTNPLESYPHCDRSTSSVRYEPSLDRISTTLSWSSKSQFFDHPDKELTRDLDKVFDLLKGISQRKLHLVKSIQHLQRLTRNIVDYFRPEAVQHAGDMDEQVNTSTSFSAYVKSPTLTAHTVAVRRSTRNSSPVHLSSQPHDRSVEEASVIDSDLEELAHLKSALLQLTSQLDANPTSSDQAELIDLRAQLADLVVLKEEQVLESKKSTLLRLVQEHLRPPDGDNAVALIQDLHDQPGFMTATKTVRSLVGHRCSIPGWTSRGEFIYQNAVVCDIINDDATDVMEHTPRVRVFLAHPTQANDVPCLHFVDNGFCSLGIRCPYSHGKVVRVKDLKDWRPPDLSKFMCEGQRCLVKDSQSLHGLWRHARLLLTDLDAQCCVIDWSCDKSSASKHGFRNYSYREIERSLTSVPMNLVHFLDDDEDEVTRAEDTNVFDGHSESTYSSGDEIQGEALNSFKPEKMWPNCDSNDEPTNNVFMMRNRSKIQFVSGGVLSPQDSLFAVSAVVPSKTSIACENNNVAASAFPLGAWETHTRGIGSRLLLKMGYDGQSGLGRSGEGRVLPVSLSLKNFQIVPKKWGKRPTLDRIMIPQKDKTALHRQVIGNKIVKCPKDKTEENVFSFLNSVLQSSRGAEKATHEAEGNSSQLDVSSSYSATNSETHLRVRIFYLHKEIGDVLRQIDQAQMSADRNEGQDHLVVKQAKRRLDVLRVKLAKLHESERACSVSVRKRINEKKLRFF